MRSALWVAVVMLVAGCADEAPPQTVDVAAEEPREGRAPARAPLNATSPPAAVEVAWDGALPPLLCAPSGPNSCMGASAPAAGENHFVARDPAAWSGNLTLQWEAMTPVTETLAFGLLFYEKCGATCWQSVGGSVMVSGQSPLVLAVESLEAPASAEGLWLFVHEPRLTPDPVYAVASPGQEFRVAGRLEAATQPDEA
jgi:hypothetical protein